MESVVIFVKIFFELLGFAIIVRVVLSWIGGHTQNRFTVFIHEITEPVLKFIKKLLPPMGMMDLSPLVALIGLDLIKSVILYLLGK